MNDPFPLVLQNVTWTCTATAGSACSAPSGTGDLFEPITLARGGTVIFSVTGTLAANATGSLVNTVTITPPTGVWDPTAANSTATDTDDIDTIPQAAADTSATDEDTPVIIAVLANDLGLGDPPITVVASPPLHGSVVVNPDNTVTYTPEPDYHGPDAFSYTVTDGDGQSSSAVVSLTIASVDDVPQAAADSATTDEDTATTIDVLTNDDGLGDAPLTVTATQPQHGSVVVNPEGTIRYTPVADYHGPDSFTYTVTDGDGQSSTATVTLTVTSVDDVPLAAADNASTAEDTPATIPVLVNDSGLGDPPIAVAVTQPQHGTAVVNPNRTVTYTPAANYHGPDSFTYTVTDGDGQTSTATVSFTVTEVNDAPVAVADFASINPGTATTIDVLANDVEVDGDPLTIVNTSAPQHGTVVLLPGGTLRYTPAAGYTGADQFTYTVSDGRGGTSSAIVRVVVGLDSDGDGLPDSVELDIGTDPNDGDSDDDGVRDGDEPRYDEDSDGDGLINALDPDSDNDGLFDGTELGRAAPAAGTDLSAGNFIPDGDAGLTTTDPLDADSDDGGVSDGAEDTDGDGVVDPGELDPNNPADDQNAVDSDGDGLPDAVELRLGTDPADADSDDDGVRDGDEPNWRADSDGDGLINPRDPDSDDDGLFDGTEVGVTTPPSDTDRGAGRFIPDGDGGATRTSPLRRDSDGGGVNDGDEDTDRDGVVDEGERDPNDAADDLDLDVDGLVDADDNCPEVKNPDQEDRDRDGLGDACDSDADGDGLEDGFGVSGGGCSIGGAQDRGGGAQDRGGGAAGSLLPLLFAALLVLRGRRPHGRRGGRAPRKGFSFLRD